MSSAVVTGAAMGIGRAVAARLVDEGARSPPCISAGCASTSSRPAPAASTFLPPWPDCGRLAR